MKFNSGNLTVDCVRMTGTVNGVTAKLGAKEFRILAYFNTHAGQVVTTQELFDLLNDKGTNINPGLGRVHLSRIKDKFKNKWDLETVRGGGYRVTNGEDQ